MRSVSILLVALLVPVVSAGADAPVALDLRTEEAAPYVPVPEAAAGIGPGSRLFVRLLMESSVCTANFLWTGSDGRVFLGTAGHCLLHSSAEGDGPVVAPSPFALGTAYVCVARCEQRGSADFALSPDMRKLGPTAYAIADGVGADFGIVEVPPELHSFLRPGLPMWGAVSHADPVAIEGTPLGVYGNGLGVGEVWPTMGRAGVGAERTVASWSGAIPVNYGDSGAAVVTLRVDEQGVQAESAVGLVTHGVPGYALGTTIEGAKGLAAASGFVISPRLG